MYFIYSKTWKSRKRVSLTHIETRGYSAICDWWGGKLDPREQVATGSCPRPRGLPEQEEAATQKSAVLNEGIPSVASPDFLWYRKCRICLYLYLKRSQHDVSLDSFQKGGY